MIFKLNKISATLGGLVSPGVVPVPTLDNRIIVKQAADLAGILSSTKQYFLDGVIDMGTQAIEIPSGGLHFAGYDFDTSQLVSTEDAYTMFTSPIGGSGNITGMDYAASTSGAGSQVFDIVGATGDEAFEFSRINYNDCTSLGTIDNFRQGFELGTGRFGGTPELTLAGVWAGGFVFDTAIVRGLTDGAYTLFKAGAGFAMASRFRSNANIDLPASVSFFDFAPAAFTNPSTVQLVGCIISRNGVFDATDTNITPNMTPADLPASWHDNVGTGNTFVGGTTTVTVAATTTINTINVFEDLAGTWTATGLQHFDAPANGQLRHIGNDPREYSLTTDITIEGTGNDIVGLKLVMWDDSASGFVDIATQTRPISVIPAATDSAFFTLAVDFTLDQNDYVMMQVNNQVGTNNVTATAESHFAVSER